MAAYCQVYDSRHLQAAKNRDPLRNPTLGNRVGATNLQMHVIFSVHVLHCILMRKSFIVFYIPIFSSTFTALLQICIFLYCDGLL